MSFGSIRRSLGYTNLCRLPSGRRCSDITHEYDSQCVEVDEFCVDAVSVALQQTGHQSDHIEPRVAHRGVQHAPRRLHHIGL
ncbi:hypothetical protein EYF80_049160 [Liparis tanakae]|uniref:Uncharacterized protein n=1 Tax=Liparis tanakae TaxID=230148 RepID=A0A4Z2FHG9_9TELE|nr:hypothetical protein EYF80_049160 [Liparis tanakae]